MTDPIYDGREAATELNVSRATLYAYVSRGLIRSEASENGRNRLYQPKTCALRARKTKKGARQHRPSR